MRSLKECYEIAKKYHAYWSGDPEDTRFMCIALEEAQYAKKLTNEEFLKTEADAMSLVRAHSSDSVTLKAALGSAYGKETTDEEVKAYWNKYIDNMENQDG